VFFAAPRFKKSLTCRLRVFFARVHSHLDLRPHAFAHMSSNQTASTTKHPSTTADGTTRGSLDEEPGAASGPEPILTPVGKRVIKQEEELRKTKAKLAEQERLFKKDVGNPYPY
jgi:hypothetical protein